MAASDPYADEVAFQRFVDQCRAPGTRGRGVRPEVMPERVPTGELPGKINGVRILSGWHSRTVPGVVHHVFARLGRLSCDCLADQWRGGCVHLRLHRESTIPPEPEGEVDRLRAHGWSDAQILDFLTTGRAPAGVTA